MSVISITISAPIASPELVGCIRKATGAPMAQIAASIKSGSPIFEREIFDNYTEESVAVIRQLLISFSQLQINPIVHEDGQLISVSVLANILNLSEDILAQVLALDERGHS